MKVTLNILLLFALFQSSAQNLVPNPSFEKFSQCPDQLNQVPYATGWSSFGNTPDYYNACNYNSSVNSEVYAVPDNYYGFQYAAEGDAYCGLISWAGDGSNYREMIGAELITPLESGVTYYVSLKFNFPYREGNPCFNTAIKNLGVRFTNFQYSENSPHPVDDSCHVCSNQLIMDTLNWIEVSGTFTPDQQYNYIVLGNFYSDASTDTMMLFAPFNCGNGSAYYVDEVCVSTNAEECNGLKASCVLPNVFSPNNDGTNDFFKPISDENITIKEFIVINRWGNTVYYSNENIIFWNGECNDKPCTEGSYFWKVLYTSNSGETKTQHGFVQLIR